MKKGFTLIELLVTITIFSIVITGFLGLFASAFKEQRKNLNLQYLLQNTSYISEYMSRALRMAKKDINGNCITPKDNFALLTQDHIKFLNYNEECQEFFLDGEVLKVRKLGITQPLTSSNLIVERLKFEISGETQEDTLQPKVIFSLKIKNKELEPQELNLQTTISQRDLDVRY
ncbi:prepilin-type N-terminal cleavage/methylation domain-containing protein [Patescibacteria group bacterium]|nr:prepilin-type N-terminal cleavage/methylation domain-containing protein [Patescibacteria group bacterium]